MAGNNPISQFEIIRYKSLDLFGFDISLTNSSLSMILAVLIGLFIMWPRKSGSVDHVPSKWQIFQEMFFIIDDNFPTLGRISGRI